MPPPSERTTDAGDVVARWLEAGHVEHPRPAFRASLRSRLMATPPAAAPRPWLPRLALAPLPAAVWVLLVVVGTAMAASLAYMLIRGAGPAQPRPEPVPVSVVGATVAVRRTATPPSAPAAGLTATGAAPSSAATVTVPATRQAPMAMRPTPAAPSATVPAAQPPAVNPEPEAEDDGPRATALPATPAATASLTAIPGQTETPALAHTPTPRPDNPRPTFPPGPTGAPPTPTP